LLFCIFVGHIIARLILNFIFDRLGSIQLSPGVHVVVHINCSMLRGCVCLDFLLVRCCFSPRVDFDCYRLGFTIGWCSMIVGLVALVRWIPDRRTSLHRLQIGFTCPMLGSYARPPGLGAARLLSALADGRRRCFYYRLYVYGLTLINLVYLEVQRLYVSHGNCKRAKENFESFFLLTGGSGG
jgi:hypothetical protein